MGDYSFVVGNGLMILLMALGMGFFGGAQTFTGENIVIGDSDDLVANGKVENVSQVDFDTDRLLYNPDFESFETPATSFSGYIWNGAGSNGTITYDASNADQAVIESKKSGLIPGINLDNLYLLKDGVKEQVTSNYHSTDLSNTDELIIVLTSQDAEFLGFDDSTLVLEDAVNSSNMKTISYTVEEGFFDKASNLIGYSFVAVAEVFGTLKAWVDFVWIIPNLPGWIMKGYIGIFLSYLLAKEIWLG